MSRVHANDYSNSLNGAITNSATSITVNSATGLPAIGANETYNLTITYGETIEIVTVTDDASTPTLTVTRGVEGTTGTAFASGAIVELNVTADSLDRKPDKDSAEVITGSWDFGGAGSLEIPNGATPTVDAAGEIALNTTSEYIVYHDGTAEKTVRVNRDTAFNVYRTSVQSIANVTTTKIQLNAALYNYGALFDASTNYRYTPDVPGVYIFVGSTIVNSGTDGMYAICQIRKNGVAAAQTGFRQGSAGDSGAVVLCTVAMNGSTDYVEFYVYQDSGVSKDVGAGSEVTFLTGGLLEEH